MSVSMDGVTITDYRAVVKGAHHDLTPLPDGKIATLVKTGAVYSVIEVTPDGTITPVVADVATLYSGGAYTNAIHYYPLTTAPR